MYKPTPGSLAARVIDWFRINSEEELTRSDIAKKFDVPSNHIDGSLATAIAHQVIVRHRDASTGSMVFKAGPTIAQTAPTPPMAPVLRHKPTSRERLPDLDLSTITIAEDAPPPPSFSNRKGVNKYDELLTKLVKPGMAATGIPVTYRAALAKAVSKYQKDHEGKPTSARFVVRTIAQHEIGVWRIE